MISLRRYSRRSGAGGRKLTTVVTTTAAAPTSSTVRPYVPGLNAGASDTRESASALASTTIELPARPGKPGPARMRDRLIDAPTKIRPANAADAPTAATKKSRHCSVEYAAD